VAGVDRRFSLFGPGKGLLPRAVAVAAAVLLALAALGLLTWGLVTSSESRLAWLEGIAAILAVVLAALTMTAQILAWARRNPPKPDNVLQLRPLAGLDPFVDLGVHLAVEARSDGQLPDLPPYVPRDHDARLRQVAGKAAGGASQLVVVVGGSSTGKTRACQEMLAALPGPARKTRPRWRMLAALRGRGPQWLLWHPIDPTPPEAVMAGVGQVGPRTVVWLDEAQRYLDTGDDTGERVAAGLHALLGDPGRGPVLVVATLWPEYWSTLTTRTDPDRHAQARDLLSGHKIDVPEHFSPAALSRLAKEAGADPRLAEAADRAADGQITQYLAGAPCLLDRYQEAPPGARALISAAMDARRLECGPHLPLALLKAAAPGYLTDTEWNQLADRWLDKALAYATELCNGVPGPLTRIRPRNPGLDDAGHTAGTGHDGTSLYLLADYLDQHGRRDRHALIPPPSFWTAAPCAQPADLTTLAAAARARGLYQAAAQLCKSAAAHGDPHAGADLIDILHDLHPGDHRPAQWVTIAVVLELGDPAGVASLLDSLRKAGAQDQVNTLLARDPAAHVSVDDPGAVISLLAELWEAGEEGQVNTLAERAAKYVTLDDPDGVTRLLDSLREADQQDLVKTLLDRDPAAHVDLSVPGRVAGLLDGLRKADEQDQVKTLLDRDPAAHATLGNPFGVASLLDSLRKAGAQDQVNTLLARDQAERAAKHAAATDPVGAASLLDSSLQAGEQYHATARAEHAARITFDDPGRLARLLDSLREAGEQDQVNTLLAGDPAAHLTLGNPRRAASLLDSLRETGEQDQVTALVERAARITSGNVSIFGRFSGIARLLDSLRKAGAPDQATALADRLPGEGLFRLFCAQGNQQALYRFGRNPDGSPAAPWGWEDLE
jgi:uncharacterized protein YidB (DUF937 family)